MQTSTPDLQSLVTRVDKLERQNRLFKRGGLALLLAAATLILMGQARPSDTLEAHSFVLSDSSGIKRAELAVLAGGPDIRFFDAREKARTLLSEIGYVIVGTGTRTALTDKGPVEVPINRLNPTVSAKAVDSRLPAPYSMASILARMLSAREDTP